MPGISIHVVDVSRGVVAAGMRVTVTYGTGSNARQIVAGAVGANGLINDEALNQTFAPGVFSVDFHVADYYRSAGIALPDAPFLDVVTYRFGIADPAQHYHLPMKLTPWGYSCFRGGA